MFFFTKNPKYYFKQQLEDTVDSLKRNKRTVWHINTATFKDAHFAVYPPDLIIPCIKAGSKKGDIILDPFIGSGTTAMVAKDLGRHYIGCELHEEYSTLIDERVPTNKVVQNALTDALGDV